MPGCDENPAPFSAYHNDRGRDNSSFEFDNKENMHNEETS